MNEVELKRKIESVLHGFALGSPANSAKKLLNALGYESDKTFSLSPNTFGGFAEAFIKEPGRFDPEKARAKEWKTIDVLFQITDDEIRKNDSLFQAKQVDNTIMESYLFFALSLAANAYTRGDLVKITREINKLTPMPAMILFHYGHCLTIAVIDRRLHKREASKDVLEKVTLIKDINLSRPHRAHVEILFDLALLELIKHHAVTNFVELHRAWGKTLDTSELNKRFYRELANWYFWAVQEAEFPADTEKNRDIRNATSVIRLITRLIFVWFVKEKGLVPDELFDERAVRKILLWNDFNESSYYKAILQNLFFATLNTEMNKDIPGSRKFRGKRETGRDQHYMIHNVFRYEDYFVEPAGTIKTYFDNIPFLNGGLFECLDKEVESDGKKVPVRVDGFSNRQDNPLKVPDELFFSRPRPIDLNGAYGTKSASYEVRGIINILDHYKFTIDENTPIEEEVALDPELLGKVFENLLASYNPETQMTARKQTGSYYTPREIVNYMADVSLKAYLKGALTGSSFMSEEDAPIALDTLFAYTEKEHFFNEAETRALIDAIDNVKLLDPACGSGAFPMGILHKLVYVLGKLDPNNEKWRERQRHKAISETEEAYRLGDQAERQKRLLDIDDAFENNASDYGRKLYLIENCIYGADIQPIAVQIAKLRFFISLVVDQNADFSRINCGIRPLPNLETRFVAADTLVGIKGQWGLRTEEISQKEKELKKVRETHFTARTRETKEKYRKMDKLLRGEISALLEKSGFPPIVREKLAHWDPYDQNGWATFFDPEWMFGLTEGFDMVIANPPYVRQEKIKALKTTFKEEFGDFFCGTADLYTYFYKRGIDLLKVRGHLCFIAPNKFMRAAYGKNTRELLAGKATPRIIIDFCDLPIFDATTYPAILLVQKGKPSGDDAALTATFSHAGQLENVEEALQTIGFPMPVKSLKREGWILGQGETLRLMEKLRGAGTPLGEYVKGRFYYGIKTGFNEAFVIDAATRDRLIAEDPKSAELIKPWLRGRDIKKWRAEWAGLYVIFTRRGTDINKYRAIKRHLERFRADLEPKKSENDKRGRKPGPYEWFEIQDNIAYYQEFEKQKIVYPDIAQAPEFTYDTSGSFVGNTAYIIPTGEVWLLALLNSKCFWWFYIHVSSTIRGGFVRFIAQYMEQFPIPPATTPERAPITSLAQAILADPDSQDVPRLEAEIDQLVYGLYGLDEREIAIIEGRQ
jgi:adenine-specific DNA-methyltransferase